MVYFGKKLLEGDISELADDISNLSNVVNNKNAYFTKKLSDFTYHETKVITGVGKLFYFGMPCTNLNASVNTRNIKAITLESNKTTNIQERPAAISFITFQSAKEFKISLFDLEPTREDTFWNDCTVRIWVDLTVK